VILTAYAHDLTVSDWVSVGADGEMAFGKIERIEFIMADPLSLIAKHFVAKDETSKKSPISAWVLITGVIRDEAMLLAKLAFFNELKSSGDIEQVVFSTWKGELDKSDSIKSAINTYKFIVVESDEPDIVCLGHFVHQIITIKNGLEVCPNNSFVLRARTDKCGPESGFIEENIAAFFKKRDFVKPCRDEFGIFDYKIGTMRSHTQLYDGRAMLFFWNDRVYFGAKKDLQKFLNFNVLAFGFQRIIPEQALFSAPFTHDWPIISMFFNSVNQIGIVGKIFDHIEIMSEHFVKFLIGNRLFKLAFITEKYLLYKYFFDIPTGEDFQFIANFHSVDMTDGQELENVFQLINSPDNHSNNFSAEIKELVGYLQDNLSIHPATRVTHEVGEIERYVFSTPSSNISTTKKK
jgi:hypothetical protein